MSKKITEVQVRNIQSHFKILKSYATEVEEQIEALLGSVGAAQKSEKEELKFKHKNKSKHLFSKTIK